MKSLRRYTRCGRARGVRFFLLATMVTCAYVTMVSVQPLLFGPKPIDHFRTAVGTVGGRRTLFATGTGDGNLTKEASVTDKPLTDPLFPPDLFSLPQKQHGAVVLHVIGMVYMFVALAIVCDEFFIPALDVIIEKLEIQDDVAGATFMAAGGSAPELFTSVIGVFVSFDDVGIGTIVGSAVFNILFVIGMCALFSRSVLNLTWWPLFRDVSFYSISLIVLIGFFLDNFIYWWEALLLLLIYACYVYFMRWNVQVERWMKKHLNRNKVARVSSADQLVACTNGAPAAVPKLNPGSDTLQLPPEGPSHHRRRSSAPMIHAGSKFRHGLLQLMIHSIDPMHDGQQGKLDEKATQIHAIASLKVLLDATRTAGNSMSAADTATATTTAGVSETDSQDNLPSLTTHSVAADCSHVLQDIDTISENDQLQEDDIREMSLSESGNRLNHVSIANSLGASRSGEGTSGINETKVIADELEGKEPLDMSWPDTNRKRITYICLLPIVIPLWITLPDPRKPEKKKWFALAFIGSIIWIAIFSYMMVWWASQVGKTFDIPNEVMGLTFLAAGTSIPDLITSVIVARKGLGDMAVSSSIGSNIFDVTVGLPLPWFLYGIVKLGQPVQVSSKGMVCSIVILFVMLVFVIMTIACCRWKMNKSLGVTMFLLYFVFLAVSLLFEYGTWTCPI